MEESQVSSNNDDSASESASTPKRFGNSMGNSKRESAAGSITIDEPPTKHFITPAARKQYVYADKRQLIDSLNLLTAQAKTAIRNGSQLVREIQLNLSNLSVVVDATEAQIQLLTYVSKRH